MHAQVIEAILMLINAIVGFPDDLKARVKLRAELVRLQVLDVLAALHRERHVEIVRQVEVRARDQLSTLDTRRPDATSCAHSCFLLCSLVTPVLPRGPLCAAPDVRHRSSRVR